MGNCCKSFTSQNHPSNKKPTPTPSATNPLPPLIPIRHSIAVVPDSAICIILSYLTTFEQLRSIETSSIPFLSASLTRNYCHNIHLEFDLSPIESSDSDDDSDYESTIISKTFDWSSALLFCSRRSQQIQHIRISPPEGCGVSVFQLSDLAQTSHCKTLQMFQGPRFQANEPTQLVQEISRIKACQRSYDSEYSHEYGVEMVNNIEFLNSGGNTEEALTLLNHINAAVLSTFHCTCKMGALSHPYGESQSWVNLRKKALTDFLPLFQTYETIRTRIDHMRASALTRHQVQLQISILRRLRSTLKEFVLVVYPNMPNSIPTTSERTRREKEFVKNNDLCPYNKLRVQVLLPLIDTLVIDLHRVLEFLDGLAGGNEIEHWMMLDDHDKKDVERWTPKEMTTVGQALDTLRTDPEKFKAFAEMTRHMSEMMRLD